MEIKTIRLKDALFIAGCTQIGTGWKCGKRISNIRCDYCGNEYDKPRSAIKGDHHFCSTVCGRLYYTEVVGYMGIVV
jgi:hypothetical protein